MHCRETSNRLTRGDCVFSPSIAGTRQPISKNFRGIRPLVTSRLNCLSLSALGEALQTLSSAGASSVSSPQFGSSQTQSRESSRRWRWHLTTPKRTRSALAIAADTTLRSARDDQHRQQTQAPLPRAQTRGGVMAMEAERAPTLSNPASFPSPRRYQ